MWYCVICSFYSESCNYFLIQGHCELETVFSFRNLQHRIITVAARSWAMTTFKCSLLDWYIYVFGSIFNDNVRWTMQLDLNSTQPPKWNPLTFIGLFIAFVCKRNMCSYKVRHFLFAVHMIFFRHAFRCRCRLRTDSLSQS